MVQKEHQGAHPWVEIYLMLEFQSDWCVEYMYSASLAEESYKLPSSKKEEKFKETIVSVLPRPV